MTIRSCSNQVLLKSLNGWKWRLGFPSKIVIYPECSTITWSSRITMALWPYSLVYPLANSPRTLIFFWIKAMKLPKKMWNCKDSVHGRPMSGTSVSFDLFHTSKGFQRHFPCPKQCGPIGSLRAPSCCSSRSWPKITTHTDVPFCRHQPAGCSWLFSPPFRCTGLYKRKLQGTPPKNKRVVSCTLHVPLKLAQVH